MKIFDLLILGTVTAFLLGGCRAVPRPPTGDAIDTRLPVISLNGHIEDMKSVAFEWKIIDDPKVNGIFVYRSNPSKNDFKINRYDVILNRFATHYTDINVMPDTKYQYAFTTFSDKAQSEKSIIVTVTTIPALPSVSWIQCIQDMPRSVKIVWTPHTNSRVSGYILERKTFQDIDYKKIAQINGRFNAEYIDNYLEDGQTYKYRLRAVTYDNVISAPSEVVEATTKSLPADVRGIAITDNLPKKIRLSWPTPAFKDLSYYKVYRSKSETGRYTYYAKLKNNVFVDEVPEDGKTYFYKVTTVDNDGLESNTDVPPREGSTLAPPNAPDAFEVTIVDNKAAELKWEATDPRAKSYTVTKSSKTGWFSSSKIEKITGITGTSYKDTDVFANVSYRYEVVAVDGNGLESEPTQNIKMYSKELPTFSYTKTVTDENSKDNSTKSAPAKPENKAATPSEDANSSIQAVPNLDTSTL